MKHITLDPLVQSLVAFVSEVDPATLSEATTRAVTTHVLDTVGCGAGGFDSVPARAVREVVRGTAGPMRASAYGEAEPILVDHVALANGTANRYLDFSDFGLSGHPSDMIPPLLALAEVNGADGARIIASIYAAYEIATSLAESVPPDLGWDQGLLCSIGVVGGAGVLLDLPADQMAHAFALAIVPSVPLKVTRFGEVSQWKAAATAHATMTAVMAVRFALAGLSGPPQPFEGRDGIFQRVWPRTEVKLTTGQGPSAIERSSIKRHAACYWAQVPVSLAYQVRERTTADAIASIEIATCATAWRVTGGGSGDHTEKWNPKTRETADHSTPYTVAITLLDGELVDASFSAERLADPQVRALMQRITVNDRADLTQRATRDTCPTEMTVTLNDGTSFVLESEFPEGHPANPMTLEQIQAKFDALAANALEPVAAQRLSELLWNLPALDSISEVSAIFRQFGRAADE